MVDNHWPFDEKISEYGFPFAASIWSLAKESSSTQIVESLRLFHQISPSQMKAWFASMILSLLTTLHYREKPISLSLEDFQGLFDAASVSGWKEFDLDWLPQLNTPVPLSAEWIDFFDSLGRRRISLFEGGDFDWPQTEQIVNSFSSAPEARRGLLPLLAGLAVSGNKCEVPREVIKVCRGWEDSAKEAAVLLSLARGDWTAEEASELAQSLQNESNYTIVWRAFRVLRRFPRERASSFALALLRQLPTASPQGIHAAMSVLTEFLNNRPSSLGDPEVWRRLNFPEPV